MTSTRAKVSPKPSAKESFKTGSQDKRDRIAAYVEWLLLPQAERDPKTKVDFAASIGVTYETLRKYEQEPLLQRSLGERARAGFKALKLPEVIAHLTEVALGETMAAPAAQVSATKVLLDWAEKTSAIREEQVKFDDLSEGELVELALSILQRAGDED